MVAFSEIILPISLLSEEVHLYDTTVPTHKAKSKGFDAWNDMSKIISERARGERYSMNLFLLWFLANISLDEEI